MKKILATNYCSQHDAELFKLCFNVQGRTSLPCIQIGGRPLITGDFNA